MNAQHRYPETNQCIWVAILGFRKNAEKCGLQSPPPVGGLFILLSTYYHIYYYFLLLFVIISIIITCYHIIDSIIIGTKAWLERVAFADGNKEWGNHLKNDV